MINTRTTINYLMCELKHLAVGDVLDHSDADNLVYETIRRIDPMQYGTRLARLEDQHGNRRSLLLTSIGQHKVISGPKLAETLRNPDTTTRVQGAHRVWKGE